MSKITGGSFSHGRKSGIGTSAVQLTTTSSSARNGVLVKAGADNAGRVYPGTSPNVTADSNDDTDGFELTKDGSVIIEVDDPSKIFLIASEPDQKVFWIGL